VQKSLFGDLDLTTAAANYAEALNSEEGPTDEQKVLLKNAMM
jgi:hypothetical protein